MKLNVGCGTDYMQGYVNIDGSDSLPGVDKVMDISQTSLRNEFEDESCDEILAKDILEHHFHWEAVQLLKDFFMLLKPGGKLTIRVPDCESIINNQTYTIEQKLTWLYGGQDVPQGRDLEMDASRLKYPQYFCHKYGWTIDRIARELEKLGFTSVKCKPFGDNLIAEAFK